jgi:DNA-binding LacI/PurR family transcriptional regulator
MGNRFPTPGRRSTIGDVAESAGVSKATVSKFLGDGDYYVSEDARRRISAAVKELDFRPNAIARDLKRRRTQTVGVIVASVVNPLYAELIAGVDEVLGSSEYTLIFGSSEGSAAKEAAVVRSMQQRQVDGIVMASVTMGDVEVDQLMHSGLAVVLASRNLLSNTVDAVVVDNLAGARAAMAHLASHGHRRIAHIAGPQDVVPFTLRRQAHAEIVNERGLDNDPSLLVIAEATTQEAGAAAIQELLDLPEPPTAVFVGSDGMALGVLEGCAKRGLAIPLDLAVVGFDDIWVARMPGIQLTTVDSQAREVGRKAARQLLARIEGRLRHDEGLDPTPNLQTLPARLVRRRTCGCNMP